MFKFKLKALVGKYHNAIIYDSTLSHPYPRYKISYIYEGMYEIYKINEEDVHELVRNDMTDKEMDELINSFNFKIENPDDLQNQKDTYFW